MRINLVQRFGALLGLGVASFALADFGQDAGSSYVPPSKWSRFNAPSLLPIATSEAMAQHNTYSDRLTAVNPFQPEVKVSSSTPVNSIGAKPLLSDSSVILPVGGQAASGGTTQSSNDPLASTRPYEDGYSLPAPGHGAAHPGLQSRSESGAQPAPMQSPYMEAMSAPWSDCGPEQCCVAPAPTRLPLCPWFGGVNALVWTMEDNSYQRFLVDDADGATQASSRDLEPDYGPGFEVFAGKYLACGQYGLSLGYFQFNPESQYVSFAPNGAYRPSMPQYNNVLVDHDNNGGTAGVDVYTLYDVADSFRLERNVDFQGLEVNLSCFGVMGARRVSPVCGDGYGYGPLARMKRCIGLGNYGTTGAGGALASPCGGCAQVVMSHGFRWFQFNDDFLFSSFDADYSGVPVTMNHDIDVENNLYGYQFGGRLNYCVCRGLVANFGAKGGLYGNDISVDQRLGTELNAAYPTGGPTDFINVNASDVVLSGLGELDLGLGYRLNNCWTLSGGYRALYATGVATSIGSISNDFLTSIPSTQVYADDSVFLHGAYLGASMNW